MKNIKPLFIVLIMLIILTNCDNIRQNYHDMLKYPEIKPFVLDSINFRGNLNIDNSSLKFSFSIKISYPLIKIDSIASVKDWLLIDSTRESRMYVKDIKHYPADFKIDTLKIKYNEKKSRLSFNLY